MALMVFELNVEMDGAEPYRVIADQRDIARWEVQSFGWPFSQFEEKASMGLFRFLAWSASVRQQRTQDTYEAWSARCIEALPVDDEESEQPADAADPGQTEAQDKPSSASRGTAARRSPKS